MKIVFELVSLRFSFFENYSGLFCRSDLVVGVCCDGQTMTSSFNLVGQINTAAQLDRNTWRRDCILSYKRKPQIESFILILRPGIYVHPSPQWIICCQLTFMQKCNSMAIHYSFQGGTSKKKKVMSSCEGTIHLFNKSESPSCSNEAISAKSSSNLAVICSEGGFESGLHDRI